MELVEQVPRWIYEFGSLVAQNVTDQRGFLTEPFAAALAAWEYEHDLESGLIEDLRRVFPETLAERCGLNPDKLSGDPGIAFGVFMAVLVVSLRVWRIEPPPEGHFGSVAAHWCTRHPGIFSKVQEAHLLRASYPDIAEAAWTVADVVSAHGANQELPKSGKLELRVTVHFTSQRTWKQAAQTAAYALFGDFLLTEAESIGFCSHCAKPFLRGQKKLFCDPKCAHSHSAIRSQDAKTRESRRKTFRMAARALKKWLEGRRSARSDWRTEVQNAARMQTRDNRQNRTLGAYIRVSRTEAGSPEREKLLNSLRDLDTVSEGPKGLRENDGLQRELDDFLRNIKEAEKIRERSKRK